MPPPSSVLLPLMVLLVTVSAPKLNMPPPARTNGSPPDLALLPLIVEVSGSFAGPHPGVARRSGRDARYRNPAGSASQGGSGALASDRPAGIASPSASQASP
jgi:hypothetical protein